MRRGSVDRFTCWLPLALSNFNNWSQMCWPRRSRVAFRLDGGSSIAGYCFPHRKARPDTPHFATSRSVLQFVPSRAILRASLRRGYGPVRAAYASSWADAGLRYREKRSQSRPKLDGQTLLHSEGGPFGCRIGLRMLSNWLQFRVRYSM